MANPPNPHQPWGFRRQQQHVGTGCLIVGRRILTSAHVLKHAVYVEVQNWCAAKRYVAEIAHVDHGSELGILTVGDESFFVDTQEADIGSLPQMQSEITLYGYPVGGEELAVHHGRVTRIEVTRYGHSWRRLLALESDVLQQPGSSGGPAFMAGLLVGIAFQSRTAASRGYLIPTPLITRFLSDAEDGVIGGVPDLGVSWQKIENVSMRKYLSLDDNGLGVMVTAIRRGGSSAGVLQERDVLCAIDGTRIASDGLIDLADGVRAEFSCILSRRQVGDQVSVDIMRGGVPSTHDVQLRPPSQIVPPPTYAHTRYFIFGGLVFTVLTYEYLSQLDWKSVDTRFRQYYFGLLDNQISTDRIEIVFVSSVLAHDVNAGYSDVTDVVVQRVNGREVNRLSDVVDAVAKPLGNYHVIEVDKDGIPGEYSDFAGTLIVLDASMCELATKAILTRYSISSDRSVDLR